MISQLNFNIGIGIFEIFILRLHEKTISTATSKKSHLTNYVRKNQSGKKELDIFFTERPVAQYGQSQSE